MSILKKFLLILILGLFLITSCEKKTPTPMPNYPPVIEEFYASTDRVRVSEKHIKVVLRAIASDKNSDQLAYSWTATSGTLTSTTSSETEWYAPPNSNIGDEFTITVWVMDVGKDGTLKGGKVSATHKIKIVEDTYNRAPIIKKISSTSEIINSVALKKPSKLFHRDNDVCRQFTNITAEVYDPDGLADNSDEEGRQLTYSWQATGGIIAEPENTEEPPPPPTGPQAVWYPYNFSQNVYSTIPSGEYTITLTVTDPKGESTSKSITIQVMWGYIKDMPTPRWGLGCAVVNGKIYAIGGQSSMTDYNGLTTVEEYDPSTNTWTTKPPLSEPRSYFAIAAVNDKIYIIGGYSQGKRVDTVLEYDPSTGACVTKTSMPGGPRSGAGAGVWENKIYVIGGFDINGNPLTRVEEYDVQNDRWTTKAGMPTARGNLAVVSWNNKIYAVGGFTSFSGGFSTTEKLEVYTPYSNSWESRENMPTPRGELTAVAWNNKIYAIGGISSLSKHRTVEEFNVLLNSWRSSTTELTLTPMPTPRNALSGVVIANKIYAIGGCDENNKPLKIGEVVEYP